MDCNNCRELLGIYVDEMLDEVQSAQLRAHLDECDSCIEVYEQMLQIKYATQQLVLDPNFGFTHGWQQAVQSSSRPGKHWGRMAGVTAAAVVLVAGITIFPRIMNVTVSASPEEATQESAVEEIVQPQYYSGASSDSDAGEATGAAASEPLVAPRAADIADDSAVPDVAMERAMPAPAAFSAPAPKMENNISESAPLADSAVMDEAPEYTVTAPQGNIDVLVETISDFLSEYGYTVTIKGSVLTTQKLSKDQQADLEALFDSNGWEFSGPFETEDITVIQIA